MSIDLINQRLMQSVQVGLAIIDPTAAKAVFSNESFKLWFGINDEKPLGNLEGFEAIATVLAEPSENLPTKMELSVKPKRKPLSLHIHMSSFEIEGHSYIFVEAHNQTKVKELEAMINSYAKMMEKNEREIKREKERAEKLLLNIMPKTVLAELKEYGVTAPTKYDEASVIMIDFVNFTEMSIADDPSFVVSELNDIFTNFDRIVEQFGCERIKTIGDAYMAVSGVPEKDPDHAKNVAKVALLFVRYLERRNETHRVKWLARIGIASGPVIGSIVGIHKYVYDIFGPAVNLAARMEARAETMTIAVCDPMLEAIKGDFNTTLQETRDIKGFGTLEVHRLGEMIGATIDAF